jgi:hypothetical protein
MQYSGLNSYALAIEGTHLPETTSYAHECWYLGEAWGGSTRQDKIAFCCRNWYLG